METKTEGVEQMQSLLTEKEYADLLGNLQKLYREKSPDIDQEDLVTEFCHTLGNISAASIVSTNISLEQFKELIISMETDNQLDGESTEEINYAEVLTEFFVTNWQLLEKYIHNLSSCLLQGEDFELPLDMEFSESDETGFDFSGFALGFIGAFIYLNKDFAEGKMEDALYEAFVPMYYLAQIDIENEYETEEIEIDENNYLEMCDNLETILEDIYKAANIDIK